MATVTFQGTPIRLAGDLPRPGQPLPPFRLTAGDLSEVDAASFRGRVVLMSIVPSLDTPVCATSARRFNEEVGRLPGLALLNISADLPFAQGRVCSTDGLAHVVPLSTFRSPSFGTTYGVRIEEGPLTGLLARAVLVAGRDGVITYAELVPEITQEPDYAAAMAAAEAVAAH